MNKKNSFLKKMACATALLLSTSSVALATNTEDFTGIAVFGDSFVDGNIIDSKFVDDTWAKGLTEKLGFTFTRDETNFAHGAASSANLITQLDNYLAKKNKFGPNDLVIYSPLSSEGLYYDSMASIWGFEEDVYGQGHASDLQDLIDSHKVADFNEMKQKLLDGSLPMDATNFPRLFGTFLAATQANTKTFMEKAIANGANYIAVSTRYNDGLRLFVTDMELYGILSQEMGKAQIRAAQEAGVNLIVLNDNIYQELCDNPDKYLTAEEKARGSYASLDGKTGVFDLTSHPTTPVHKILSQFKFSVFTSPTLVSTLREIPLASGMKTANMNQLLAQNFALTHQLQSDIAGSSDCDSDRRFAVQVFGDFGKSKTGKFSKKDLGFTDDSSWDFGVGLNYKTTDNLVVGANVSYSETRTKFEADRGNSKIKEKAVSLHGIYSFEQPVFVYASAGYGKLDYDITRRIKLGLATRTENGKPSGDHFFGTLGTGYRFDVAKNISITPFVAGHYQSISMNSYNEGRLDEVSTVMAFDVPKRESIMAEVGVTFAGKVEATEHVALTPSLTVSYLHDWKNPLTQNIKARNRSMEGDLEINYFKMPGYNVDKDTMKVQGSLLTEIDNKYQVGVNASCRPTGRVKSWSVGIKSAIKL